jgi:hypothetical protein
MIKLAGILLLVLSLWTTNAFADSEIDAKLEFAGTLEETLGHFWALELNLDEKNAELALVHATHPIAELYETMRSHLESYSAFDAKLQDTLLQLQHKANTEVSREDAQAAIEEAKEIIEEARIIVVGEEQSNDVAFKAQLINGLLETSKVEYMEAVSNGIIEEMAEFQDGSAFVWRSQQIFEEIKGALPAGVVTNIKTGYEKLWSAYDVRAEPAQVEKLADAIITEFEAISGVASEESKHMEEVFGPKSPLKQVKSGVSPTEVKCKPELELIIKSSNGQPACVSSASADKLVGLGWGTRV